MEGGLDDTDLLTIGSPKIKEPEPEEENKENVDSVDFIKPKIPSPKKRMQSNLAGKFNEFKMTT
jgi:hypothetical protein